MEWSKIKNILIAALILTNLILLYLLISDDLGQKQAISPEILEETLTVLEKNGISVACDISLESEPMSVLTLTYDTDNGSFSYPVTEESAAERSAEFSEADAEQTAKDFLRTLSSYDSIQSTQQRTAITPLKENPDTYLVTYRSYYQGRSLSDNTLLLTVSPAGVTKMEKYWASVEPTGNNKQEIIPVTTALLKYMTSDADIETSASRTISNVALVYKVDSPYDGNIASDTAFPTWEITTSDGIITYISAYQ